MLEARADPLGALLRWSTAYGGVVRVKLRRWTYLLNEPEDVRHVLLTHQSDFHKGEAFRVAHRVFGQGLLASEEPTHMAHRRQMLPAFHREALHSYAATMVERTDQLATSWRTGTAVDVVREMRSLTLAIAAHTLFGVEDAAKTRTLADAVDVAQDFLFAAQTSLWRLPEWFPSPLHLRYHRAVAGMDRIVYGILRDRQNPGPRPEATSMDLLALLRPEGGGRDGSMSDRELRDEVLTLLLAGHETTANALAWTLYLVSLHPEVDRQLIEEYRSVLGDGPPNVDRLSELELTERVVSESLRLFPPAWLVPRVCVVENVLPSGVRLEVGDEVVVSPWAMHRNPGFFSDPTRFDPGRFSEAASATRPAFAYFPFGGGNRRCIGEPFARMELAIVLASLLRKFRFEIVPGQVVEPEPRVTLSPRYDIRLRPMNRTASSAA